MCARNRASQEVIVRIAAQRAWMCARTVLVHTNAVTTGASGSATPIGTFRLLDKQTDRYLYPLTGGAYYVHYWLPFEGTLYGFHDATWQRFAFGGSAYRTAGSHGCVHMPLADMKWLYRWARVGATIAIR
jgi:lipoprotein-anchoring transpeptidase ErfK/SrfK